MRNTQTSAMAIGGHQYATQLAWRTTTADTVLGKALSSKALAGERCRVRRRAPSFTTHSTGGSSMAQAGINVGPFDARARQVAGALAIIGGLTALDGFFRSEEHTSELQSQSNLVCRLLLEKKKSSRTVLRI